MTHPGRAEHAGAIAETPQTTSTQFVHRTRSVRGAVWQGRGLPGIAILTALWIGIPWSTLVAEPTVHVRRVDDTAETSGTLTELTAQNVGITVDADQSMTIPRRDLRSIRVQPATVTTPDRTAGRWHVQLTSGDRVTGDDPLMTDDALHLRLGEATLALPLEFIRGWWRSSGADEEDALRDRHVACLTVTADTLLLSNGDRLTGELIAWDTDGLNCRTATGKQTVPSDQTTCVILDPALTAVPERPTEWALVQTHDGSRLSVRTARLVDQRWQFDLLTGTAVTLAWDQVARVDFFGERIQPLTTQPLARFESTPYLSLAAGHEFDRNVRGGPLALRGDVAAWGVGVSSGSRLVWSLEPGWTNFETTVGIDDAAEVAGSVEFIVRVDGVEAARSGVLTGRDSPHTLGPLPLNGTRELELLVEYADRGDIGDMANWFRPVLLK